MNDTDTIRTMLENVGLHVRGIDTDFIYIEDPTCIIRGFENFLDYAWMVLGLFTGGLIIGWGISMIRGAKNDIKENFKTLVLIFGILTAVWPILNLLYGGDLLGMGCTTTRISIDGVNEVLAAKVNAQGSNAMLYEDIDIYDSGSGMSPNYETPEMVNFPDLSDLLNWVPTETVSGAGVASAANVLTNIPAISADGRTAVTAKNSNVGEITYTAADGSKYTHIGGTLTWRANNPGALRYSDFTRRMGAIGATTNGFAIFPNAEVGRNADVALLKTSDYQNKTLAQAMHTYAPSFDGNNPASYAARLARAIGVTPSTYLRDMSDAQIQRMVEGIRRIEGWRAGTVRNN